MKIDVYMRFILPYSYTGMREDGLEERPYVPFARQPVVPFLGRHPISITPHKINSVELKTRATQCCSSSSAISTLMMAT